MSVRARRLRVPSVVALLAVLLSFASVVAYPPRAGAAAWRTVMKESFEGVFPPTTGNWSVYDYNGPSIGSPPNPAAKVVWDDTSTKAHTGYWSAHPNAYYTYANNTDTWMKYGPIDLSDAIDARVKFAYWLDTEKYFDYFTYGYSCANDGKWSETSVSGSNGRWRSVRYLLTSCIGSDNVYIRFMFKSDYSNPATPPGGVWVDSVKVQKLS